LTPRGHEGTRLARLCHLPARGQIAQRLQAEGLESFVLDYTDEDSIAAAVETVTQMTGGKLDALFNNGAFACPGAVEDLPRGALRAIFETNLFGYHDLARRVIPMMRARELGGSSTVPRFSGWSA
jgi:NAD(P)-dependent dehydrogenase (short-subunit alcohol dehydrogenase family)